jgi:hypothetical protein
MLAAVVINGTLGDTTLARNKANELIKLLLEGLLLSRLCCTCSSLAWLSGIRATASTGAKGHMIIDLYSLLVRRLEANGNELSMSTLEVSQLIHNLIVLRVIFPQLQVFEQPRVGLRERLYLITQHFEVLLKGLPLKQQKLLLVC